MSDSRLTVVMNNVQPMNLALRSQDIDRIRPFSDNTDKTLLLFGITAVGHN